MPDNDYICADQPLTLVTKYCKKFCLSLCIRNPETINCSAHLCMSTKEDC